MKLLSIRHILKLLTLLVLSFSTYAQDDAKFDISCEVNVAYPALSVTPDQITSAENLADINRYYKTEWVRRYKSLEIQTYHDDVVRIARSTTDKLTPAQTSNILTSDPGSEISISLKYIPENTLSYEEEKEFAFEFVVNPISDATYSGGREMLNEYLNANILEIFDRTALKRYQLTAAKFTIDRYGNIKNAETVESSKNEALDNLLIQVIKDMPTWAPATYSDGTPTEQDMVLTLGDMESCVVNLLNIRREN